MRLNGTDWDCGYGIAFLLSNVRLNVAEGVSFRLSAAAN